MGNSSGVIIPKVLLGEMGVQPGDDVDMTLAEGKVTLTPIPRAPRAGWAEASRALAAAGDDAPVWPAFANADDASLEW
ncbi:MAG: AbrB/MazE/SpoVT family DNA-binding domain-containing protein [Caulobacteraceae bacterium]